MRVLDTQRVDGDVLHFVEEALEEGSSIQLQVDWSRRYDHMQCHTGEQLGPKAVLMHSLYVVPALHSF